MGKSSKSIYFFLQRVPSYILWLLSFFFIRSKNKWCFGSQTGFLGSNSAYLLLGVIKGNPELKAAWVCSDVKTYTMLKQNKIPVLKKWSIKGIWFSLTSKVYVYTHGVGDINFATSGNTFKVNLWHGISYKKVEYQAQLSWVNKHNPIHRVIYPFFCVDHDLILSTSDYISTWLKACFRCSEKVMLYNFPPRCQTRNWETLRIVETLNKYNPQLIPLINQATSHRRSFFYMPTYREKNHFSVLESSNFDLKKMNGVLRKNNDIMFVKFHPRDLNKITNFPVLSNIVIIKDNIDPYLFFPYISVLITDYSSVYAEYLLYNKNIIIFDFDREQYEKNENGCYYDIDEFVSAIHAKTFDELLNLISSKGDFTIPRYEEMYRKLWDKCDDSVVITDQILSRIK